MSLLHVIGFGLKVGHLLLVLCCWIVSIIYINWFISMDTKMGFLGDGGKMWLKWWEKILGSVCRIHQQYYQCIGSKKIRRKLWRKLLLTWVLGWCIVSLWIFCFMNLQVTEKRKETLASMCDERARMLQDQFNVSMNHIQAMSILISTFHHAKNPSAIDQRTFAKYTERTAFERPLTSGVAYAVRVLQSEREQFEKQQGWSIKRMDTMEQNPVHEDDYVPDELEPSPVHEEYAPVIFAQDTISHVISIDVLSGKEDRENVLRARESGKGVLTAPFRLLKTNRLGVILTFAVYKRDLPPNATPNERIQATDGYLGGVFEIESLVEKLLQQLASKQTVIVSVYDTTNHTHSIPMYGSDVSGDEFYHVSFLNFGDPFRKHEMHCRFKQKPPWPWLAITTSFGILVIALLVGHICHATVNRIANVEDACRKMTELKKLAEAADVAKSQFLATVSHEIRTPMNGVLGMMNMLMDTDLDVTQQEYVRTAQGSGKSLSSSHFTTTMLLNSFTLILLLTLTTSISSPIPSPPPHSHFQHLNVEKAIIETKLKPPKQPNHHSQHKQQQEQQPQWKTKLFHRDHINLINPTTNNNHKTRFNSRIKRDIKRVTFLLNRLNKNTEQTTTATEASFGSDVLSGTESGSGEYFVRIGIGSPPIYQYMVIDSGSDIVWIQCQPCDQCYNQSDPIFNPATSASFIGVSCSSSVCNQLEDDAACRKGRCGYQVAYGDGSYTKGTLALETITVGRTVIQETAIGCGHWNEGMFVGAAGLLGLGGGPMSFVGQLGAQTDRVFGYCLTSRGTGTSGSLEFGRQAMPVGAMWVPLIHNPFYPSFYYVSLTGLAVGGIKVPISEEIFQLTDLGTGGVVMDTGTAVTRLPTVAYNAFRDAFIGQTTNLPRASGVSIFDTCYDLNGFVTVRVPTVSFYFSGGQVLTFPARNFLIPADDVGTFCFAFAPSGSGVSIIGNIQQEGIQVSVDGTNGFVGFGPDVC